jgi:hypothetical protein
MYIRSFQLASALMVSETVRATRPVKNKLAFALAAALTAASPALPMLVVYGIGTRTCAEYTLMAPGYRDDVSFWIGGFFTAMSLIEPGIHDAGYGMEIQTIEKAVSAYCLNTPNATIATAVKFVWAYVEKTHSWSRKPSTSSESHGRLTLCVHHPSRRLSLTGRASAAAIFGNELDAGGLEGGEDENGRLRRISDFCLLGVSLSFACVQRCLSGKSWA